MNDKLEIFKKKMLYRASYRGTKEMDILLSSFVKKYIDKLNTEELIDLEKFLNYEDQVINDFYNYNIIKKKINLNKISAIFKSFKM